MAKIDDERFMRLALDEAHRAAELGEVPIGAVVVYKGEVIAHAHNRRELDADPSAHAEFAALREAARALGRWRLTGCTVYVTLEPCCMCAGLMVNARVDRCVYGAADAHAGALGSLYDLSSDAQLNHSFEVARGTLGAECAELLTGYFEALRTERDTTQEAHAAHEHARAAAPTGAYDCAGASVAATFAPAEPHFLLAIDSFKGSASSLQAEAWVEEGVRHVYPAATVQKLALADGGEGTVEAFQASCGGTLVTCTVDGPLGQPVEASLLQGEGWCALEMAQAAGITQSPCTEEAALAASTFGVGQLLLEGVRRGAKRVYIGLGGSASNDGGAGFLQALGARLLTVDGQNIAPGLQGLSELASVDLAPALEALSGVELIVLSDVTNPLVGERGALAVFGKQKGLPVENADKWASWDSWMLTYGRALDAARPTSDRFRSVVGVPGAGAAGGLGAALLALGAHLQSGIETLLDAVNFNERVRKADCVVTGEGNMDAQSAAGKAPVGVARRAKAAGKPAIAVVGGRSCDLEAVYEQGVDLVLPVCRKPMSLDEALTPQEARQNLICAGEAAARAYMLG